MHRFQNWLLALLVVASISRDGRSEDEPEIRFNRDIRPILSDHCFQCHGPDAARRKAGLRFDQEAAARSAIVAGKPNESELVHRIESQNVEERMPPAKFGRPLTNLQIALIRRWVAQGAKWEQHWAFVKPEPQKIPRTRQSVQNPIDAFIVARLEKEGLALSPPAARSTLIRRMTFDLTGMPPTPQEVDEFEKDNSPDAAVKLANRLLASPRYGERMAWRWLEAARYADTNGYQTDGEREMWRWRDWVIDAYNRNLSFDRFTIEQLAGDLLPHPTLDQRIATGFNRNHRGNAEGGIVPEEYAVEYVADRVETTSTVWLGLTAGCARCHDHKFDPLPQKDYYRLFAFFNTIPEKGRAVKFGNSPPLIKAPTPDQNKKLEELQRRLDDARKRIELLDNDARRAQTRWEASVDPAKVPDWFPTRGLAAYWSLESVEKLAIRDGRPVLAPGRVGQAVDLDGKRFIEDPVAGNFGFDDRFTLTAWVNPRIPNGAILSRMTEEPRAEGYSLHLVNGKLQVHFIKRWLDDALRVETTQAIPLNKWTHISVGYDASRLASGVTIFLDGVPCTTVVLLDELNQSFNTKEPFRIGSGGGQKTRFDGLVDEVRIYGRRLDSEERRILAVPETISEILRQPAERRTPASQEKLRMMFVNTAAEKELREAFDTLISSTDELERYTDSLPTVMVMEEMPTPRDTFILKRGEYDKKGEKVQAEIPAMFLATPSQPDRRLSRLDLARWLISPTNPLTARVAVNRMWQLHFGTGLVKTVEDFGTQGEYPSHPELLDWLAVEFQKDWDIKRMHKLIVTSAAYQQSSVMGKCDVDVRLLSRFPRARLSSEMLRDQALLTSGLLVEKLGGPSVKPYQPAGLWQELTGAGDYVPDHGDRLYRRGLYTFWKRTVAPPVATAFDSPTRETCWVRETRTNTPLQALALLNETSFVESARVLAQRVIRATPLPDERLKLAFRSTTGRHATPDELRVLRRGLEAHLLAFRADPAGSKKLSNVGEYRSDPSIDPPVLAAYTMICNTLLNLDEVVTKE